MSYRAPELVKDKTMGFGCDIWALGCILFEIRTRSQLFSLFDADDDSLLYQMVMYLGMLPEPWWTRWETRKMNFTGEEDSQGRASLIPRPEGAIQYEGARSIQEAFMFAVLHGGWGSMAFDDDTWLWPKDEMDVSGDEVELPGTLEIDVVNGGDVVPKDALEDPQVEKDVPEGDLSAPCPRDDDAEEDAEPTEEELAFIDLLERLLKYHPNERLTARQVQDHKWFKMED
jgi:serine/threonine protein kinase